MFIYAGILGGVFLLFFWFGYMKKVHLEHLNRKKVINGFLILMVLLTAMSIMRHLGYFSQSIAVKATMTLYTIASGYFFGFGSKLAIQKKRASRILYAYRSIWSDMAPNTIAVIIAAFGIYRTGLLSLDFQSGIALTSGISLIGFGCWGWTIRIVPEFRDKRILFLDQSIAWKRVLSYSWISENSLSIDYVSRNENVTDFRTFIPDEDRLEVEKLLGQKMKEYESQRENLLSNE